MRLTKKKAIELSIELWTWLAETGKEKEDWPSWEQYGETTCECFLCEYSDRHPTAVNPYVCYASCPYYQRFGCCYRDKEPYDLWLCAKTARTRKKYAKLFLEQLQTL